MVGILLISHYTLAQTLKETIELIIGERKNIKAICVSKDDKIENFAVLLEKTVKMLDEGDGVLIFADMFGGSPCNVALSLFAKNERLELLQGLIYHW